MVVVSINNDGIVGEDDGCSMRYCSGRNAANWLQLQGICSSSCSYYYTTLEEDINTSIQQCSAQLFG